MVCMYRFIHTCICDLYLCTPLNTCITSYAPRSWFKLSSRAIKLGLLEHLPSSSMVFPFQQPIYQGSPIKTIHLQLMFHDFPSKNLHFFMGEVAKRLMKSHSECRPLSEPSSKNCLGAGVQSRIHQNPPSNISISYIHNMISGYDIISYLYIYDYIRVCVCQCIFVWDQMGCLKFGTPKASNLVTFCKESHGSGMHI